MYAETGSSSELRALIRSFTKGGIFRDGKAYVSWYYRCVKLGEK